MMQISILSQILDLLMPRACGICGNRLTVTEESICAACNLHLPRTNMAENPEDNDMARMFWGIIPIEKAAAWFNFEPHSQAARPIYSMKYNARPETGECLGRMFAEEIVQSGFFEGIDLIVPIPLAHKRERQRGYNQSMMIARGIHEVTDIRIEPKAVKRTMFEVSQTRKNWWERRENVDNVFKLVRPESVSGKHLLLVDDIMTTGATLTACARELLKAGDVKISVLTLGLTKS